MDALRRDGARAGRARSAGAHGQPAGGEAGPGKRDAALAKLARPLEALEAALTQGGGYLVGGRFTVADLNVANMIFYLRASPEALQPFPALAAWYQAATGRPAFRRMIALREAG